MTPNCFYWPTDDLGVDVTGVRGAAERKRQHKKPLKWFQRGAWSLRLSSGTTLVLRAAPVMRRLILLCFQNEEPTGQFSHNLSSVSHVVQSTPLWFQLKLFMNQLAAVIQLEANIIGQQLWIGSIFARPCCKRGLPCGCARTFCHSSPNALAAGCVAAYRNSRCDQRGGRAIIFSDIGRKSQNISESQDAPTGLSCALVHP